MYVRVDLWCVLVCNTNDGTILLHNSKLTFLEYLYSTKYILATIPYLSSLGLAPGPRCVQSAGQLDVTIYAHPGNAYIWETRFSIGCCGEFVFKNRVVCV